MVYGDQNSKLVHSTTTTKNLKSKENGRKGFVFFFFKNKNKA